MADIYGQLVKAQAENLTATPGTLSAGLLWCRTDTNVLSFYDGAATRVLVSRDATETLTGKTLTGNIAVTLVSGAATITLPTTTGTLATLANTEAFTNKDYQGGTASNTSRLTVPSAALSTLTGLTRKAGTIVYDTTGNQLLADDGSNLNAVGSGAGEKNYIAGSSTASGWTASGAGITVATTTSGLPRANTTKTGILLTGVSGSTAYAYYRFVLDDADANKKLKIQFDMEPGTAVASDFKVDIYSNTASDYTTGNTRLVLSTDSSAVSALPALTGTYRTSFDAPATSAKYIEIRVGMNATQTHTLVISDVVVGPGTVTQGAAISGAVSYTPTFAGVGTATAINIWYRRVGTFYHIWGSFITGTVTGTTATMTLPNGESIDSTLFTQNRAYLGMTILQTNATGPYVIGAGIAAIADTGDLTKIYFAATESANTNNNLAPQAGNAAFASSSAVEVNIWVPSSTLAGAGTVNVVNQGPEWASNSGTWDATDTTSFAYGPAGSAISGALTASRSKTVRFQYPFQAGDQFVVEYQKNGFWIPDFASGAPNNQNATVNFGAQVVPQTNGTDVIVTFAQKAAAGTTFNSNTGATDWSTSIPGTNWRVKKFHGDQAVGFGAANTTAYGLVSREQSLTSQSKTPTNALTTPSNWNFSRVGKQVVITWAQIGTPTNASTNSTVDFAAGTIPSDYAPSSEYRAIVSVDANGVNQAGAVLVNTDGSLSFYASAAFGNFTSGAATAIRGGTMSWTVN